MTIFITSFHPLISRNILRTGLLERFSKDNHIIILVPDFKKEYFLKEFGSASVRIEGVDMRLTWADLIFRKLALVLANTKAVYIRRRAQYFQDKGFLRFLFYTLASKVIGGSQVFLMMVRFTDMKFFKSRRFENIFDKYSPDLVFSTDLQNELDVRLLKEAKVRRVRNVGMIRSWDNLTSKGIIRIVPDQIVVQNKIVLEEAVRYDFIRRENISVVGIPHYDKYFADKFLMRADFIVRFGPDLSKKTILFAPIGDRYIRSNNLDKKVLEILSGLNVNILVRLPPTDTVNFKDFKSKGARVVFQETGVKTGGGGKKLNEINKEDDETLALSLRFCDLVVTGQSTIAVDAAVFDKPVIAVNFDSEPRVYWDSVRRYYDYEYYLPILKSGGVKVAESPEKLMELATKYLEDPDLDKHGRKVILNEQAQFTDGKSTERLADILISYL
jgi:hypothetical protein